MQHTLEIEGFGMRLRPVRMSDAEMIVWLRNLDYVRGRVGDSAIDIAAQEAWLADYFERENDYYFIVETLSGTPLGTHALYNISGTVGESGRYIIRPEVVAAVPSSILALNLAFDRLGLSKIVAECVATNRAILSLNRKFGFKQTKVVPGERTIGGQAVDMIHFDLDAADWPAHRERLMPLAEFAEAQVRQWDRKRQEPTLLAPNAPRFSEAAFASQI